MTGNEIKRLREGLHMVPAQFAQVVAVNVTTLYRWELKGDEPVQIEPLQLQLLTALSQQLATRRTAAEREEFGRMLLTGLLLGGGLFALFKLLEAVFDDDGPSKRQTGSAANRPTVGRKKGPPNRRRSS